MKFCEKSYDAELVIVGAGFAGICAAIQAARRGVSVALINDRGVLGGNTSAEIGVSVDGSCDGGQLNINSREGGICSEILIEYFHRTPMKRSRYIFDGVLTDFINSEKNIKVFLNTCIDDAITENSMIKAVWGTQNTTETRWKFIGKWFVDNTGDGALGALAGAEFMLGREAKETFGETIAPDKADKYVIPSTLTFHAFDAGYKVPYKAPKCSFDIPASGALSRRIIPQDFFHQFQWYYEIAGEYDHVRNREEIIRDHKKLAFGIWDYIKNSGEYPQADTYDIEYMACIPGTREYRRLVGDYILTEKDIINQPNHKDTVGHGGWNIDLHALKGFFDEDLINRHVYFDGVYKIPYRSGYSKNIENLFMCGRCMSSSHVAFGSTRVTATLSTLGQAVGMAASLCKKYDTYPRGIYQNYIKELQQQLLMEDQLIIGCKNEDNDDLAKRASITCSSTQKLELAHQKETNIEQILESQGLGHMISQLKRLSEPGPIINPGLILLNMFCKRYDGFTNSKQLDSGLALSIPVENGLEAVKILIKASKDTKLKYNVYKPKVIENYGPDKLVYTNSVQVKKSNDFYWIKLPIDININNSYILIELTENKYVELAVGGEPLPNTIMFRSYINNHTNHIDYSTLEMSKRVWVRAPLSICYKVYPEQNAYDAKNVKNGYNRAYGKTNMWVSDRADKSPSLTLKWEKPIEISKLQITFAIDTTKRIEYEIYNDILDFIGQKYSIYAIIDKKEVLIKQVKDNHMKVNKWFFRTITTDEIIFKFEKAVTNQVGVYEVRVYR